MDSIVHAFTHVFSVLFFVGAVGSIATVVLFAIELARIAFDRDKSEGVPSQAVSESLKFD